MIIRAEDHGVFGVGTVLVGRTRFARVLLWAFPGWVARVDAYFRSLP